ncbi:hypothetical protein pb186bvf_019774 [Paramecium bursaria]
MMIKAFNFNVNQPNQITFDIRIPITGFHVYLNDMQQLKMILGDQDDVKNRHLQRDLSRNQMFHNISGLYPVYKSIPGKDDNQDFRLGYQQIEIDCNFILIQKQIELCKQLKLDKIVDNLQQLLQKENKRKKEMVKSEEKGVQYPQPNIIFPTENEKWMEQPPDEKLKHTLFAQNPFQKQVELAPVYQKDKYIGNDGLKLQQEFKTQNNQVNESELKIQNVDKTVKFQNETMDERINSFHCQYCCPSRQNNQNLNQSSSPYKELEQLQESGQKNSKKQSDLSPNKAEYPPMRHTKPGSGQFNKSPTGFKFAKKTDIEIRKKSQKKQYPNIQQEEPQKQISQTNTFVQTEYIQQPKIELPPPKEIVINKDLSKYQKLKVEILDFHPFNETVMDKLVAINMKNMFIDSQFKLVQRRFFFKKQGSEQFYINDFIEYPIKINEVYFKEFQQETIKFDILCYRKPDNADDNKYFKMQLGEGYFQIVKALNPEEFYIPIQTNLPFERQSNGNSNLQFSVVNKDILQEYNNYYRLGNLRIRAQFIEQTEVQQEIEYPFYQQYQSFNPSLLIEIDQPKDLGMIYCRYKIPGSNDIYSSQESSNLDYRIVTPFNYDSFYKCQNLPFMIEIWKEGQVLGIIRINLSEINKIIDIDNFNSNIFKNEYPLLIQDDYHRVRKIKDQAIIGEVHILVAFGTPQQVYKLNKQIKQKQEQQQQTQIESQLIQQQISEQKLNQDPPELKKEESIKQETFNQKFTTYQQDLNTNQCFIKLFEFIHNLENDSTLEHMFGTHQFIDIEQFNYELQQIGYTDEQSIYQIMRVIDYRNQNNIKKQEFIESYMSYILHRPRINIEISKHVRRLCNYLKEQHQDPLNFIQKLIQSSKLGFMTYEQFSQQLINYNTSQIQYWLNTDMSQQCVSIKLLNDWINQYISQGYVRVQYMYEHWFCAYIYETIQNKTQVPDFSDISSLELNIHELQEIFGISLINLSFWEVYNLIRYIKINQYEQYEWKISVLDLKQHFHYQKQIVQEEKQDEQKNESQLIIEDKENMDLNVPQIQKYYKVHKFNMSLKDIQNLNIDIEIGTPLDIEFKYPLCDQIVKSLPMLYSKQQTFNVPSDSLYTFIQQDDENNIDIVDNLTGGIIFKLNNDKQILGSAILTSQELSKWMEKEEFNKTKILMFNNNSKLTFNLHYIRHIISQEDLMNDKELFDSHNQVQQQLHLPKRLSYSISAEIQINSKLIDFQDKFIQINIISGTTFTKKIPKSQGSIIVQINEEQPIEVTEQFIQNLQTQPLCIEAYSISHQLNLIGKCQLNQQILLKETLEGEFALTNKNGLFAGFAKIKCKLNKFKLPILQKTEQEDNKSIFVCLQFLEILNRINRILSDNTPNSYYIYFSVNKQQSEPQLICKNYISEQINSYINLELQQYEDLIVQVYQSKTNKKNVKDIKIGELGIRLQQLTKQQQAQEFLCITEYFTIDADVQRVGIKIIIMQATDQTQPLKDIIQDDPMLNISNLQELSDIKKMKSSQLQSIIKSIGNYDQILLSQQICMQLDKQNFKFTYPDFTIDLLEAFSKADQIGYIKLQQFTTIMESFYSFIQNLSERSYTLFTKTSLLDKYGRLNEIDSLMFLSKINIQIQKPKRNYIGIEIIKAVNLQALNQGKPPNPIIQISVNDEIFRTPVKIRESNPIYNFVFYPIETEQLEFKVLNSGDEKEYLGSAYINSSELTRAFKKNEAIKIYIHGSKQIKELNASFIGYSFACVGQNMSKGARYEIKLEITEVESKGLSQSQLVDKKKSGNFAIGLTHQKTRKSQRF